MASSKLREAAVVALLLLAVTAGLLQAKNRWRPESWRVPAAYSGDALHYLAMAKASAECHAWPFLWKEAPRLNAPFGADWNDFPIVNEPLWSLLGVARKLFGVAGGTLAPLLLAHLLAALGFYLAARHWRAEPATAAVAALLFALSPYLLRRGFVHLNLAFAWHLPLAAVVAWWAADEQGLASRGRWLLGLAIAVACGLQATYYALFFLLLLGGALAAQLMARRTFLLARPAALAALTAALAASANLDTLSWQLFQGDNPKAAPRALVDVDRYALRPVELLLPRGQAAGAGRELTDRLYFLFVERNHETGAAYLGLVGVGALLALLGLGFAGLQPGGRPPPEIWAAVLCFAFAVAGGGNMLLAVAGVRSFRAGNRVSILLLAIALLFLARRISAWRPRPRAAALAALAVFGLWDQLPAQNPRDDQLAADRFRADALLAARLEEAIPGGAIFQLPLTHYPEAPAIGKLEPYELFRLYAHSWSLRFSYGAHRGRGDLGWQEALMRRPWPEILAELRRRGFAAIAVYGHAYPDGGKALADAIRAAGGGPTFFHAAQPIRVILLPAPPDLPAGAKNRES